MRPLDCFDDPDLHNGDGASRPARNLTYARLSRKIDRMPASCYGWSTDACERAGLDPKTPIGELLVHCDKMYRANGNAAFLREDLLRREGRPPAEIAVSLDFEQQYRMLGRLIRDELHARGITDEPALRTIAEAIAAAVGRLQEDDGETEGDDL